MFGLGKKKIFDKDIHKSVQEFQMMCELAIDDIWKIEDKNDLIVDMYMHICERCNYGENIAILLPAERTFYLCQEFESEINNGGFSQFYFNSSGNYCNETPKVLLEIGAKITSQIVKKANALFDGALPFDKEERENKLEELLTDEISKKLDALDNEFYEYKDDLTDLSHAYIITHKNDFS